MRIVMGWREKIVRLLEPRPGSPIWKWQHRKEVKEKIIPQASPTQEVGGLLDLYERKRFLDDRSIRIIRRQGKVAVEEEIHSATSGMKMGGASALIFFGISSFVIYTYLTYLPMMLWPLSYWLVTGLFAFIGVLSLVGAAWSHKRRKHLHQLLEAFGRTKC